MENQFLIDLSPLKLSSKELKSIDSAIQKAVSAELAKINTAAKIALVPFPKEGEVGAAPIKLKGGTHAGYMIATPKVTPEIMVGKHDV